MSKIPEDVLFKVSLEAGLRPCKGSWIGTPEQVMAAAEKLGLSAKEYGEELGAYRKALMDELTQHWSELVKKVHYVIAYFIHANDLSDSEAEEDIEFSLDQFARKCGLPEHDWDTDYEEQYGEPQSD
ncbi:hypothetical protein [uncultured Fibrobacter sp.]|uniref:hypothetical protein n=1 Tax=uncultured Fibrobacter sp. TaxID=261512 RepID=UPI0025CCD8E0|nr:hypothetical protein [uncultured Fibrobacter sp.]